MRDPLRRKGAGVNRTARICVVAHAQLASGKVEKNKSIGAMTTALTQALAALENVADRVERLDGQIARHNASAGRLRDEVAGVIRDLDQIICQAHAGDGGNQ